MIQYNCCSLGQMLVFSIGVGLRIQYPNLKPLQRPHRLAPTNPLVQEPRVPDVLGSMTQLVWQ